MNNSLIKRLFLTFSLFFSAHNSFGMEQALQSTIADLIFNILLGDTALLQALVTQPESPDLPQEMKNLIMQFVITGATGDTLEESAKAINTLAQLNKELNNQINNLVHTATLVSHLAKRFNCSEEDVCKALKTKTAKIYLRANQNLTENIINSNPCSLPYNVNFRINNATYITHSAHSPSNPHNYAIVTPRIPGGGNYIMYLSNSHSKLHDLNKVTNACSVNINLANNRGRTALMVATNPARQLLLKKYQNININQQDHDGNTALLHALKTEETVAGIPLSKLAWYNTVTMFYNPSVQTVQLLLKYGADPELANFNGLTPLQAAINTHNDQIIQLIQNAIEEKHQSSNPEQEEEI